MRPSAGTPYFARVPEILVSPQAPQDRDRATGIASPLRTPEPKADAANHATHHTGRLPDSRVRHLEEMGGWSRGERLRFLWHRLRPMVAEMNYATRRMVEVRAPWMSGDSPLNPRQHPAATSQQEPAARPRPAAPMTCRRPRSDRCAARPRARPQPGPDPHPHQWHARLQSALIAAEPALLTVTAAALPDQARAADGPSSKPNPGHGGHSRDQRSRRSKQPQKGAIRT